MTQNKVTGSALRRAGFFGERHSQAAVISCVVGDFPVPLSIPAIASLRGHHASLSRPVRLSLAQGLNGQTEAGYISSSCPILLETCCPFPSIVRPNIAACASR